MKIWNKIFYIFLFTVVLANTMFFAFPKKSQAFDWGSILGSLGGLGIGGEASGSYGIGSGYGYGTSSYNNSIKDAQNFGDIKISKEVRVEGQSKFHDEISVRTGSQVQIMIEVKNTSSKYEAQVVVRDELPSGMIAIPDSLSLNDKYIPWSLNTTGVRFSIPPKNKSLLLYRAYVCSSYRTVARAYASASGIGSATDGIVMNVGFDNNSGYGSSNYGYYGFSEYSDCTAQVQQILGTNNSSNTSSGDILAGWDAPQTGSQSSSDILAGWDAPKNGQQSNTDILAGWTNGNSSTSTTGNDVLAGWTASNTTNGVNSNSDILAGWDATQNGSNTNTNVLAGWTASNVNHSENYGIGASRNYDSSGYELMSGWDATNKGTNFNSSGFNLASSSGIENQAYTPYRVAPTTGVNKLMPIIFAGLLTLLAVITTVLFKKRHLLFN